MSRPQKIHKPLKASFSEVLWAVSLGDGKGKKAARALKERKEVADAGKERTNK